MPTLLMQCPAAGIEITLFRPEAVLLVMISPLALLYTPVVVMINRSRHNRHDRNQLRLHRHCAQPSGALAGPDNAGYRWLGAPDFAPARNRWTRRFRSAPG
jgi:hypothetical protein